MKTKEIKPRVLHVTYETQEELAKAFLPFQEFYENIHFARKTFTLDQFKEWYTEKFGKFSYYGDWSGFNVPVWVFNTIPESMVNFSHESAVLHALIMDKRPGYIIGTTDDTDPETLTHELAHARFYLDDLYSETIYAMLSEEPWVTTEVAKHLQSISYHPNVIQDEIHAYLLTEEEYLTRESLWTPALAELRNKIRQAVW